MHTILLIVIVRVLTGGLVQKASGQDASLQGGTRVLINPSRDPCHGGTKDNWGHTQNTLYFCYNGTIDVLVIIPLSTLTSAASWKGSAKNWRGYTWYLESRTWEDYGSADWGRTICYSRPVRGGYGWKVGGQKLIFSTLSVVEGSVASFRINTTVRALTPNEGPNCTIVLLSAWAQGYDPGWRIAFCSVPLTPKISQTSTMPLPRSEPWSPVE